MKPMRREARAQGRRTQATNVARFPRPLQAVHHENLAAGIAVRALRAYQNLHVRLGTVQAAFHGELGRQIRTLPEVPGDGLQVRTAQ